MVILRREVHIWRQLRGCQCTTPFPGALSQFLQVIVDLLALQRNQQDASSCCTCPCTQVTPARELLRYSALYTQKLEQNSCRQNYSVKAAVPAINARCYGSVWAQVFGNHP